MDVRRRSSGALPAGVRVPTLRQALAFDGFSRVQQMAFLIEPCHAFTVELIRTRWPRLESIKGLGTLFHSLWKTKWVPLLGVSLGDIEHEMLRKRGRFDAPRGRFEVSKIFDWFGENVRLGHRGIASLPAVLARHADVLPGTPAERERLRAQQVPVAFLGYDWKLDAAPR